MPHSPEDIPGLVLWLDADDPATITDGGGGAVTLWEDKSTSGLDFTVAPPGVITPTEPTTGVNTINSRNVINFDGIDNALAASASIAIKTIFIVALAETGSLNLAGLFSERNQDDENLRLELTPLRFRFAGSNLGDFIHSENIQFIDGSALPSTGITFDVPFIINAVAGSATAASFIPQLSQTEADGNRLWRGDVGEVIMYDNIPTKSDLLGLDHYLSHKWAIPIPLFITSPPGRIGLDPVETGGISGIDIEDEGVSVTIATALDFVGDGVDATDAGGGKATVTIPGASGNGGITWTNQASAEDIFWEDVAYGNDLFVAVSATGTGTRVMTSPDGTIWTSRTSAVDNSWLGVTFGNGLFVAVSGTGTGDRVMTSPDGINWTSQISAADNTWEAIAFGNDIFVAVAASGTGNRVMTSPDAINWTIQVSAANNVWLGITFGNGLFVAVAATGSGNRVMTSPDGITWTSQVSAANNAWESVAYGKGLFVAVAASGAGNRVMTSFDGIVWTIRSSAADNPWEDVAYGNGLFVAVSATGTGTQVMTSPDGINWTLRSSAADNSWLAVAYGNGRFVAVSHTGLGNRVMISLDGITYVQTAEDFVIRGHTLVGVTDTTALRTITISTADITNPATIGEVITINDESSGAGTNNIVIDTEGGETIAGAASISILVDDGDVSLYPDGTNLFVVGSG